MEILYIIIIVALLLWIRNSITEEIRKIRLDITRLESKLETKKQDFLQDESAFIKKETVKEEKTVAKPSSPEVSSVAVEPVTPALEEKKLPETIESFTVLQDLTTQKIEQPFEIPFASSSKKEKTPKPSFFEQHPDLEKFIGENIINKIGIGILVLGIAFFVKYAIDQNWITEVGRTTIGILAGGLLIGIAHRLRESFKAFSSVLIGGGLAVLYFTIAISFHEYHLFPQTAAFIIMVVITAFAVLLSIAYDRKELAILAIIGGFSTPFILSTGEGNYKILFTYLLILNCGMLVLAFRKKWTAVTLTCYMFTVLIFGGWVIGECLQSFKSIHLTTLLFGTAFYLIFFLMSIIYNVKNSVKFQSLEITLLLSNTFLYYSAGMSLLYYGKMEMYQGLFTAALGIINFAFAFFLYKKENIDKNLVFLLIGLVLTFISLAAPVQLEGNFITMFWAAEAVLLLWFAQKSNIELIKNVSLVIFELMLISLIMDWVNIYSDLSSEIPLVILLNKGFITGCISIVSVVLYSSLLKKETDSRFMWNRINARHILTSATIVLPVLIYMVLLLELNYQVFKRVNYTEAVAVSVGIYNFLFLIAAWHIYFKNSAAAGKLLFRMLAVIMLILYGVVYNPAVIHSRNDMLVHMPLAGLFYFLHFIMAAAALYIVYLYYKVAVYYDKRSFLTMEKWASVFFLVYLLSAELDHVFGWLLYKEGMDIFAIVRQIHKTGYSVLWGVISFVLIRAGMKQKDRMMRIIALSLFSLTLLKLFLIDIKGISEGGKILAFISLGIILLVVSFMYQRLKKLLLEDEAAKTETENESH